MYTMPMRGYPTIRITEDIADHLDIGPWVLAGQALLNIIVDSGVTINSTDDTLLGAIYSSEEIDPLRSSVTIRNFGSILGCNGTGGRGGGDGDSLPGGTGNPGVDGCDAIQLNCPLIVHNASGIIQSGGGGGGGGAGTISGGWIGGGGGGGYLGGAGGGGTVSSYDGEAGVTSQYESADGGAGSSYGGNSGGAGGECQGPGLDGLAGEADSQTTYSGGAGGLAGIGVNSLGNGVTIVSGAANIIGGVDLEV